MGRTISNPLSSTTITSVPLGGYADVNTGGDAYKLVGSIINRNNYPDMSLAFPRAGAINAFNTGALPANQTWQSVAVGAGVYVAVGGGNTTVAAVSVDGIIWYQITLAAVISCRSVAYGANLFVAMGSDAGGATTAFSTSVDGYNWVARALPAAAIVSSVIWSTELSMFIASCGYNPNSTAPAAIVYTSLDGITWRTVAVPSSRLWTSVASGPAGIVVLCTDSTEAGPGVVLSSVDGVTFVQRVMPNGHWFSVTYGKGLYVAAGFKQVSTVATPIIATSSDGINWTLRATPVTTGISSVACVIYGDNSFVAIWNGITMVSYDGIVWLQKTSLMAQPPPVQMCYKNGVIIVGYGAAQSTMLNVTIENLTDSVYMFVSGTTGKYVRVR